ncbi:hypothetical protein [Microvirga massiliensis]|uniref:hypothetical protein n=1 Tax=Microvirga massiliensis TaxID=1033741 RepID=UPI00062B48D9|nr:hypothetical protein [Microvirga massiliensis]
MHGYKAFYNGRQADIRAESLIAAKLKAIAQFKVKKSKEHMVSVHLCELDGEQVTHVAVD